MKNKSIIVLFGEKFPHSLLQFSYQYNTVIASEKFKQEIQTMGFRWVNLDELIEPGSIYEVNTLIEELSYLKFSDGSRVSKSFTYKEYELWWINYQNLYLYFCLPYTQYKKLLEHLKDFETVYFYNPPYKALFSCYLRAHKREVVILRDSGLKMPSLLPFGVFVQIILTIINIPILMVQKRRVMLFTGDKFEKDKDYDFRMKFIYEELREKNIKFVEFIRGLESWKTILKHAWKRKRPVIYSETATFIGRFLSSLFGGRRRAKRKFGAQVFASETDSEIKFKYLIATQYLLTVYDDIWAIRIMKWILRIIGIKIAIITAASDRNFQTVLGCKLNNISTIGILHGAHSRYYNVYEFMTGFDGEKMLSVDKYGLWSEWWRSHFLKYSRAYRPEQLYVSGLMRPLQKNKTNFSESKRENTSKIKVLFVSEIVAVPIEVVPYLEALSKVVDFSVYIKFRSHSDSFENWLKVNRPDIINRFSKNRILKGGMHEAIRLCDVVVGAQSTGVIESTLLFKPFVFFNTKKWGDYFDMKKYDKRYKFFAENPEELIEYVKKSKEIPKDVLKELQKRFFGDPYKNGSKWVVEQIEKYTIK